MPAAVDPPFTPFTDQRTAVLVLPVTLEANNCVAPTVMDAAAGVTATTTAGNGAATVTVA